MAVTKEVGPEHLNSGDKGFEGVKSVGEQGAFAVGFHKSFIG
jgi:hypothetical protein